MAITHQKLSSTWNNFKQINSRYIDSYLYLRLGDDEQSTFEITSNDDAYFGTYKARISTRLAPGLYTIEATSLSKNEIGRYDLRIGSSP